MSHSLARVSPSTADSPRDLEGSGMDMNGTVELGVGIHGMTRWRGDAAAGRRAAGDYASHTTL